MKKIAFIFDLPKNARARHQQVIEKFLHPKIGFDIYYLADNDELDTVLVKDMTIDIDAIVSKYMFVVPVGAEPFKKLVKHKGGIIKYHSSVITEPFLGIPIINPMILYVNPSMLPKIQKSFDVILELFNNAGKLPSTNNLEYRLITTEDSAKKELRALGGVFSYDLETTSLDPLEGRILGASFSNKLNSAIFIPGDILHKVRDEVERALHKGKVIMHNAKFDMKWTAYELNIEIPVYEDTMIVHYLFVSQSKGTHSLKNLAMEYTNLRDYSREQDEYIKKFCRQQKILQRNFSFSLIPIDMLYQYACADADATLQLYNNMAIKAFSEADILTIKCYNEILLPASESLFYMELVGAPIDESALQALSVDLSSQISTVISDLQKFKEYATYEKNNGELNLNSPKQLGDLLFNYFKFKSVKTTATGANSTDVEVLTELGKQHPFPSKLIILRKLRKLKSTYVDNIGELIVTNGRLRGNFNLAITESGRLSSSQDGET